MENGELPSCCNPDGKKEGEKKKGFWNGVLFGAIPHLGCILFIIASILGVTVLMNFFKPLLMNRYFFYWLFAISFVFATFSAMLYLKKNKMLNVEGIKKKKGYLTIMYGSTIGINILLFLLVFPLVANIPFTGAAVSDTDSSSLSSLLIQVDIPCSGHAPLITGELKTISGVKDVKFSLPNKFDVLYDSSTSKSEILGLSVFKEYPAKVLNEETGKQYTQPPNTTTGAIQTSSTAAGCCGGSGGCGGGCGSGSCGS